MAQAGGALLVETLTRLAERSLVPREQDHSRATMAPLLKKEDGVIDWTQSATEIANRIRGLSPWPGSFTFHHQHRLIIRKGRVDAQGGQDGSGGQRPGTILAVGPQSFWVETGEGRIEVLEVQPANKKRMSVEQFLQGYTLRAHETLGPQPRDPVNT